MQASFLKIYLNIIFLFLPSLAVESQYLDSQLNILSVVFLVFIIFFTLIISFLLSSFLPFQFTGFKVVHL